MVRRVKPFLFTLTPAQTLMVEHGKLAWEHNKKILERIDKLRAQEKSLKNELISAKQQKKADKVIDLETKLHDAGEEISDMESQLYSYLLYDQMTSAGKTFLIAHAHHPNGFGFEKDRKVLVVQSNKQQRDKFCEEARKDPLHEDPIVIKSRMDQEHDFCQRYAQNKRRVESLILNILLDDACKTIDNSKERQAENSGTDEKCYFYMKDSGDREKAKEFLLSHLSGIQLEDDRNQRASARPKDDDLTDQKPEMNSRNFTMLYRWLYKVKRLGLTLSEDLCELFPDFLVPKKNLIICTFSKAYVSSLLSYRNASIWNQDIYDVREILGNYILYIDEAEELISSLDHSLSERSKVISLNAAAGRLLDVADEKANYIDDALRHFYKVTEYGESEKQVLAKKNNFQKAAAELRERAEPVIRSHILCRDAGIARSASGLPIYLQSADNLLCIGAKDMQDHYVLQREEGGTYLKTIQEDSGEGTPEQQNGQISVSEYITLVQKTITAAVRMIYQVVTETAPMHKDMSFQELIDDAIARFAVCDRSDYALRDYYQARLTRPYTRMEKHGTDLYIKGMTCVMLWQINGHEGPIGFELYLMHVPYEANAVLGAMLERAGLTFMSSATGKLPGIWSLSKPFLRKFSGRQEYTIPDQNCHEIHQATLETKKAIYNGHQLHPYLFDDMLDLKNDEEYEDRFANAIRNIVLRIERKKKEDGIEDGTLTLIYTSRKVEGRMIAERNLFSGISNAKFLRYDKGGIRIFRKNGETKKADSSIWQEEGDRNVIRLKPGTSYYLFCTYRSGERGVNFVGEVTKNRQKSLCSISNIVLFHLSNIVVRNRYGYRSVDQKMHFMMQTLMNGALQKRHYLEYSTDGARGDYYALNQWDMEWIGRWARSVTNIRVGEKLKCKPVASDLFAEKEYSPVRATATSTYIQAIGRIRTAEDIQVRNDIGIYLDANIIQKGELPVDVLERMKPSYEVQTGILDQADSILDQYEAICEKHRDDRDKLKPQMEKAERPLREFVDQFTKTERTALMNSLLTEEPSSVKFQDDAKKLALFAQHFEEMKANSLNFECQRRDGIPGGLKESQKMYFTKDVIPFMWRDSAGLNPCRFGIPQIMEAVYDLDPAQYHNAFPDAPIHTVREMRRYGRYPFIPFGEMTESMAAGEAGERAFVAMFTWAAGRRPCRLSIVRSADAIPECPYALYEDFDYYAVCDGRIIGCIDVKNRIAPIDPSRNEAEAETFRGKMKRYRYWTKEQGLVRILFVDMHPMETLRKTDVRLYDMGPDGTDRPVEITGSCHQSMDGRNPKEGRGIAALKLIDVLPESAVETDGAGASSLMEKYADSMLVRMEEYFLEGRS